jgi:Zn-dependent protease
VTGYRDYDNSPLMRVLRVLSKTFAIGDFFGVHVRMYWVAAIIVPLLFWCWAPGTALMAFALALAWSALLFVVVWSHEMGHIVAGWRLRIRTDLITLSPLGGIAHMNAPAATPRGELLVALAGPAVHLLWLAVFWPLSLLFDRVVPFDFASALGTSVHYVVYLNVGLLLFNLIPFFPLDGGRCLRALLAMRVHPNRATMWATTVGIAGGALLMVFALTQPRLESSVLFVIGLSCILASLNERRVAKHAYIYGHTARQPWESDPDAWKRGAGPVAEPKRGGGAIRRWWHARREKRAAVRAARDRDLERQVDQILDRVHKVGMTGLSGRERAVLKRASQRRRGTG